MPYFTTNDGCKLYYVLQGANINAPTLVFLNGFTQTTINWAPHLAFFSKHFPSLVYDARAQGKSDLGSVPISPEIHVSDLHALLRHTDAVKIHLVGLSHGAYIAATYTNRYPNRVEGLALCSHGGTHSVRARTIIHSWLEILSKADIEAMAWAALPIVFSGSFLKQNQRILDKIVNAIAMRNHKKNLMAQLEATLKYPPLTNSINATRCPCVVITGSEDPLVDPQAARQLAEDFSGRQIELAGIGHSITAEAPEKFTDLVFKFLNSNPVYGFRQA